MGTRNKKTIERIEEQVRCLRREVRQLLDQSKIQPIQKL